jgi:hypothetical protein
VSDQRQHTRGPWRAEPADNLDEQFSPKGCVDISGALWVQFARVVVRMDGDSADCEIGRANANLIVAAPDLYGFAAQIARMTEYVVDENDAVSAEAGEDAIETLNALIALARNAVAKADGAPQPNQTQGATP